MMTRLSSRANCSKDLPNLIFSINEDEPTSLLELDNKYYIVELINTEKIFSPFKKKYLY